MNILFVLAHPDDEAYGPAGTIARLVDEGNNVRLLTLCNGARPGSEHVMSARQLAYKAACNILGVSASICGSHDMELQYRDACVVIEDAIADHAPSVVYTHHISDINADHRLVAEACLIACRPKPTSCVHKLIACEGSSSTDWTFGQIEPRFNPNMYVDVSNHIYIKQRALELYKTEIYDYPDARSIEATMVRAKFRGMQVGMEYAEAFQLIMERQ